MQKTPANLSQPKHHTILLLDWDGPVSNPKHHLFPGMVDPLMVAYINRLMELGARLVITSTIRKNFNTRADMQTFLESHGFRNVRWFAPSWRTDPHFVDRRHLEFLNWYTGLIRATGLTYKELHFVIIDDEDYPRDLMDAHEMRWIPDISAVSGLCMQSVKRLDVEVDRMWKISQSESNNLTDQW